MLFLLIYYIKSTQNPPYLEKKRGTMLHYRIISEYCSVDGAEHTVYGIAAVGGDGSIICYVGNITPNREKAERLALLCETAALSPIHLRDVAEDYVVSDTY